MKKTLGALLIVTALALVSVEPLRNYLTKFSIAHQSEAEEGKVIGDTSSYNPRVKDIQGILTELAFDPGHVNGLMGPRTRSAISAFQNQKGLKSTGWIDAQTLTELHRDEELLEPTTHEEPMAIPSSVSAVSEPAAPVESIELPRNVHFPLKSKEVIEQIQVVLEKLGLYHGVIDGKMGPQTKKAIKEFQKLRGIKSDGVMGPKTFAELKVHVTEVSRED